MAYVSTYVCDFGEKTGRGIPQRREPCKRLADAVCCICEHHGCDQHLSHALRVVFAFCPAGLLTPELPLPGVNPLSIAPPTMGLTKYNTLTTAEKQVVQGDDGARAVCELRICADCLEAAQKQDHLDIHDAIRAGLHGFADAVRSALSTAAMEEKKGAA